MIKIIIAAIATILAIWASIYMIGLDKEVNKLDKISKLIKSTAMEDKKIKVEQTTIKSTPIQSSQATSTNSKDKEVEDKLRALKQKAGNIAAFDVSPLYKKNCSSCHGNVGEGIIGPKLMGQSEEKILTSLQDFKSGKRKNYVMYGLLSKLNEDQLQTLAKEIGTFQTKMDEATK